MKGSLLHVNGSPVHFGDVSGLAQGVPLADFSSIHIICDENTLAACLPRLHPIDWPTEPKMITIVAGEKSKHLATCRQVWRQMADSGADRRSLVINLGGGVVTDLGGFCAATYMRGIAFVHIPTSVLGMSDAAIGGKQGVNFEDLKNYIGVFEDPLSTWIDPGFLDTLPPRHVRNGLSEVIKHGCIGQPELLQEIHSTSDLDWKDLLWRSAQVKRSFVEDDPLERSKRAALNFGHTIGHALESFALQNGLDLLHGEAIAMGMIVEGEISLQQTNFKDSSLQRLVEVIHKVHPDLLWPDISRDQLEMLIGRDKKKSGKEVGFVLLEELGYPLINQSVSPDMLYQAFIASQAS